MKKPALWQRSDEPFWNDEHISKQMLKFHLSQDSEAASRKTGYIEESVRWLSETIPAGGNVLDIGCGPGLYTKRLSDAGYDVTGMDYSKRSIAYAKDHDSKTKYIFRNYLELDYEETFDAVTLIYCDYAALTLPERKILLARVYRALKPGGLFVFDVFTERTLKGKEGGTSWSFEENGGFWNEKPYVALEADYRYENNTVAANKVVVVTGDELHEYLIWNTVFTPETLSDEVTPFGFRVKGMFGDVRGNRYAEESDTLCAVLKK